MKKWIICLMTLVLLTGMLCPALAEWDEDPARLAVNLQAIKAMLDANEVAASYDEDTDTFSADFNLDCKRMKDCTVWLCAYDDGVAMEAVYEQKAQKDAWKELILFMNRLNTQLRLGNFYLDESDGGLIFRVFLYNDVLPPTQYSLEYCIGMALYLMEYYGDSLEAILFDGASAEDAWAIALAKEP